MNGIDGSMLARSQPGGMRPMPLTEDGEGYRQCGSIEEYVDMRAAECQAARKYLIVQLEYATIGAP